MIALESMKLFSGLSASDLAQLKMVTKEMRFAPGELVFKEGDPGDGLYLVADGLIQISAMISGGERRVFSCVPPGDMFGEMAVLDQQPRSASASADCASVLLFIPRDPLMELIRQSPVLALTLMQEITKRLREFNRQYIREVLQAERMALVGRFASGIVHDLKNPLTIIRMAADMACLEQAPPAARYVARERIGKQVDRITNLINDILEYTRGSTRDLPMTSMDYGVFVNGLLADLQPELEPKQVHIQYGSLPPKATVMLNPQRLSRVFYNLFNNAADAMQNGGTITLRFEVNGKEVVTEVQDTGPGIPPEIADRLFEAFVTHGKPNGTGLGLSIAQRIMHEHQGSIVAGNAPSGGALFTLRLPCAA